MSDLEDGRPIPGYDWRHNPFIRDRQCDLHWYDVRLSRQMPQEYLRTMTVNEKGTLLQGFKKIHKEQSERGKVTLDRLRTIAPDVAERLFVKPDPTDSLLFRLYNGETALPMGAYTAISYCWPAEGEIEFEKVPADCLLAPFDGVTLQHLMIDRDDEDEGIWCDQVCIAQENESEKAVSVGAMDAVYQCARKVFVVLHDVELTARETAFVLEYKADYEDPKYDMWPPPHAYDDPPLFRLRPEFNAIYVKICQSKWFKRAWCAHEFLLGTKFKFMVRSALTRGTESCVVVFTDFFLGHMSLMSARVGVPDDLKRVVEMIGVKCDLQKAKDDLAALFAKAKATRQRDHDALVKQGDPPSVKLPSWALLVGQFLELEAGGLPSLPTHFRHLDATVDKISIILNLTRSGLGISRLPYDTTTQHTQLEAGQGRYVLMMTAIAAGDPTALCTTGSPMQFEGAHASRSWLADMAYADVGSGPRRSDSFEPANPEEFAFDTSRHREWIELKTLTLGNPFRTPEIYREEIAPLIIRECSALGFGGGVLGLDAMIDEAGRGAKYDTWQSTTIIPRRAAMLQLTVANVLYLGLKWMLKTAMRCGYGNPTELREATAPYFTSGFDMDELRSLRWKQHKGGPEAVNAIIRFSHWMQAWDMMCTDHGSGAKPWIPMIFKEGWKTPVLSFWPTDALCNSFVPLALLRDGYERLPRVWIIQSSGDPELKHGPATARNYLRCKTILFGAPERSEYESQREEGCVTRMFRIHGPLPSDLAEFGNRAERKRQADDADGVQSVTEVEQQLHTVQLGDTCLSIEPPD